jgi:hypothetical protein
MLHTLQRLHLLIDRCGQPGGFTPSDLDGASKAGSTVIMTRGGTRESASRRRGRWRGVRIQNTMTSCFDIGTFLTGVCKWRARVFADLVFGVELLSRPGCDAEPDSMRLGAVGVKGKGGCEFRLGQD